jgi:aspartate-semialdehyde dehydrogenase
MHVALLGATGAVGRTMLRVLAQRRLPVERLTLLASARSTGARVHWGGREWTVEEPGTDSFRGVDFALFSAGAERSREWAPRAAEAGAVVVDNSSAWRMDAGVPLVVPEVNGAAAHERPLGIVANPNCSTIQMVVALEAVRRAAGLARVVATTFQSVSGAGETGRDALRAEVEGNAAVDSPFTRPIAANVIPQIGELDGEGWTGEERKMIAETRKILSLPELPVSATCVRVPVDVGHAVQVMVETERDLSAMEAREALAAFPGVVAAEEAGDFPTPLAAAGRDEVFVGRIRRDPHLPRVLHLWIVADNLRKGAATNAVQIVEELAGG